MYFVIFYVILFFTRMLREFFVLPPLQKKKPVDFDGELKIGDVRYDNIT